MARTSPGQHLDQAAQQLQRVVAQNTCPTTTGPLSQAEWRFYKNFNGTWLFDRSRSDDTRPSIDILDIRRGKSDRESDNLKLHLDKRIAKVSMNINGLGSIDEGRSWTDTRIPNSRRDKRRGGSECWVERYPQGLLFRCTPHSKSTLTTLFE